MEQLKEKGRLAVEILKKEYPSAECALDFKKEPWKLIVMGRLSAQCTDKRVNIVCAELFDKYPTAALLGEADVTEVEQIIRPCGLYKVKARDIVSECRMLTEKYGGIVPDTIDELLSFDGVGRKIANLIVSEIYGQPAIVADTHCIRLSNRLGLVNTKDPSKVEFSLKKIIEENEQTDFCHRLVTHGREVCRARAPLCTECKLKEICDFVK